MRRSDGFTLMEMMATLAVVGIVAAILVPAGLKWKRSYAFSSMARSFSHAVLAARMQSLENKSVLQLQSVLQGADVTGPPPTNTLYTVLQFNTKAPQINPEDKYKLEPSKHQFKARYPLYPADPTARGDFIMFAGLDCSCVPAAPPALPCPLCPNGAEFEIIRVIDEWTFQVLGPPKAMGIPIPTLSSSSANDQTTPTVRNLTACGRFRVVPMEFVAIPDPQKEYQVERSQFDAKGYSVLQVGYAVTFKYNPEKYAVCWDDPNCANPLTVPPTGKPYGSNPANPAPWSFAEIRFDTRGLPNDLTPHTVILREVVPAGSEKTALTVQYTITAAGRVSGGYDSTR
jgi:prepilin-type N-terminal cleavage/methylation domain-containing protein